MAKLYFYYGTMSSGKSIQILQTVHNYEVQGKKTILLTSGIDDRSGVGTVSSRIGLEREAIPVFEETDVFKLVESNLPVDCVVVDEAQFLPKHKVHELAKIVDYLNVPVIAYGLKNDFANRLFEGTEELLLYADKIDEVKTICVQCNSKAIMNGRFIGGKMATEGDQIMVGDEEYKPLCRKCYFKNKS